MASSKLWSDVALISVTRATGICAPFLGFPEGLPTPPLPICKRPDEPSLFMSCLEDEAFSDTGVRGHEKGAEVVPDPSSIDCC